MGMMMSRLRQAVSGLFSGAETGPCTRLFFASFDKAELIKAVPDGKVELEVVGGLNTDTGQDFYGIDTIRIVSWYWWRR